MTNEVRAWKEIITIPTYMTGEPDKNPMFLEKRVYQGSSGVVYPHPVIDKVYDEKVDKSYHAIFIENDYLKIMVLPEIGGRIQMAYDKTNDYHFVYYNQVIKPALVGLAGPWISGGIEFNWPQHHRPSTFDPVDYLIEEHPDGSKTVWVSEIEKMFHTKGMAGFRLYPGKSYIEITGKLYNRTPLPQTFLWWANPAVAVDEYFQSVFPPDVHAVFDHGKRDVSSFPVATGTYYKVDYSPGTDISRYVNIPVPTSYMAVNSAFDFVGGYHHRKKAGMLHVANHHVSPGKKQWTWGSGEFGKAWDRQLTDTNGPYFELMTGMFTDNQPDFGWIMPNEERTFKQYFFPYKEIGYVKNASKDAAINLEILEDKASLKVYITSRLTVNIRLSVKEQIVFEETCDLSPVMIFDKIISLPPYSLIGEIKAEVVESDHILVSYVPVLPPSSSTIPDPAKAIGEPAQMKTEEELFLAGQHLEQYRHATYSSVPYYEEALRRSPSDARNNNALGLWYLRRGQFESSEGYFTKAIETLTKHNPNPYDGEPLYNLGISLLYRDKRAEAYGKFFKACWNAAWQDNSYFQLARIETYNCKYTAAIEFCEASLARNPHGFKVRHLYSALLRKTNRLQEAQNFSEKTLQLDGFGFGTGYELYVILRALGNEKAAAEQLNHLKKILRDNCHTYIDVAIDYAWSGMFREAISFLLLNEESEPLNLYYLSYYYATLGNDQKSAEYATAGMLCKPDRVFPNRLEDIAVLRHIIAVSPLDYKALYYLGNLWYDKRQYKEAISCWEKSRNIHNEFATTHRNLGIAYYNRFHNFEKAKQSFELAFACDRTDARVLFELDQLYMRLNYPLKSRLEFLLQYFPLVSQRDDLFIELVTLKNLTGNSAEALDLVMNRNFHPWEGGEGKVTHQYVQAKIAMAKSALNNRIYNRAIELLEEAQEYPLSLGEGKLCGVPENDIHYWLGCVYERLDDKERAEFYWRKAVNGIAEPSAVVFYNDPQPDKIFYQGLSLQKLGKFQEALKRFNDLIHYGADHKNDEVMIDYFAVSLPDLMIFDDDLNKRNYVHCLYMSALGFLGLEDFGKASGLFEEILSIDAAHQGAAVHMNSFIINTVT